MKGRHAPIGDVEGFMRAYHDATSPHPIERGDRVWVEEDGAWHVTTELYLLDDKICFSSIFSVDRDAGHASKVLKKICALADQYGVVLDLSVSPFGKGGLSKQMIKEWYERHGFLPHRPDGSYLVRQPNKSED